MANSRASVKVRCYASQSEYSKLRFSVVLVVIFKYGAQGRVDAILGTTVLYALFSILLLYKNQLIKLTIIRKDYISDALSFGLPLVPHVVGMFLLNSLDRFFINKELGIDEAGVYMFAVQLSLGVAVVFDAINKAMITWLFKSLADNRVEQLKRVVRFTYLFFVIVFLLGCLSFFIGPLVVSIVGGYKFEKATGDNRLVVPWSMFWRYVSHGHQLSFLCQEDRAFISCNYRYRYIKYNSTAYSSSGLRYCRCCYVLCYLNVHQVLCHTVDNIKIGFSFVENFSIDKIWNSFRRYMKILHIR